MFDNRIYVGIWLTAKSSAVMERIEMAVRVHLIVSHFILHYLVIFNSKSSSIDTNFDAELIKDAAVS